MKSRLQAAAMAAAAALSFLATAPAASALTQAQEFFLQQLRTTNQKWMWPGGEDMLFGKAAEICNDWRAGAAFPGEVNTVMIRNQWWTQRNASFFVALSTRAFCPEFYLDKVPPEWQRPEFESGAPG